MFEETDETETPEYKARLVNLALLLQNGIGMDAGPSIGYEYVLNDKGLEIVAKAIKDAYRDAARIASLYGQGKAGIAASNAIEKAILKQIGE